MLHGGRCHNGLMGGNQDTNYFLPKYTHSFCISFDVREFGTISK